MRTGVSRVTGAVCRLAWTNTTAVQAIVAVVVSCSALECAPSYVQCTAFGYVHHSAMYSSLRRPTYPGCAKKRTVFSERELTFTFAICRRSSVRLSVCRLSVCNVRAPYSGDRNFRQCTKQFRNLAITDLSVKILRRSSQGNPSVGGLNATGVAKYIDFGPFKSYISETVHDRS